MPLMQPSNIEDRDDDDDLEYDSEVLSHESNLVVSNFIIHEACQIYYTDFRKSWVPLSFFEFMFDEYAAYAFVSSPKIQQFFSAYSVDDLPLLIENYQFNYYSLIYEKKNKSHELCYLIRNNDYMGISLSNKLMLGSFNPAIYTALENITNHIKDNDELLNIRELYESFMIKKVVLSSTGKRLGLKADPMPRHMANGANARGGARVEPVKLSQGAAQAAVQTPAQPADQTLYGAATELPNQKGHVVKLFFPRLKLPSPYPILQEKSRINSEHRARKFMSTDRQITLINEHKFNAIKYKTGFIEKRKVAAKPAKRKFDFDF